MSAVLFEIALLELSGAALAFRSSLVVGWAGRERTILAVGVLRAGEANLGAVRGVVSAVSALVFSGAFFTFNGAAVTGESLESASWAGQGVG